MRSDQARLDPVGRLRWPRRGSMLRWAAAAALLLTAAGVLYAAEPTEPEPTGHSTDDQANPEPRRSPPAVRPDPAPPDLADPTSGGPTRLPVPAGLVGVPVSMIDSASLAVLRPGDRVDLLAVPADGPPTKIAAGAAVLAVDRSTAALLVALTPEQGLAVTAAAGTTRFAVLLVG